MADENNSGKKRFTEEERLRLVEKLDRELDDFITSLGNKPRVEKSPKEPDENWQEEFLKHPFFMKEPPKPGDELHPLFEGLQQLKYDPDENTPEELADSYKADGNFCFQNKNYRLAVMTYTEGINAKCADPELKAALFNNRSAAHYFLKNYRSSLKDCEAALKLKPSYMKTISRAAHCCHQLKLYEKGMHYCDLYLEKNPGDRDIENLRKACLKEGKITDRDKRKLEKQTQKKIAQERALLMAIKQRAIKCEGGLRFDSLRPPFPQLSEHRVLLNEENELVWPVVLLYPEYQVMDFIQRFNENERFNDHLCQIFPEPPEWDTHKKYNPSDLEVYYKTEDELNSVCVDVNKNLASVLCSKTFVVKNGGTPSFIVVVRDSEAEKEFLKQHPLLKKA